MAQRPPPADRSTATEVVLPGIRVVAAVVLDGDRVLIADRPAGKPMAGRWEFPGGKMRDGESEREALERELGEELGITVVEAREWMTLTHDYPDRRVELSIWIIERFRGVPRGLEGQRLKWVDPRELDREDMLEADRPCIEALKTSHVLAKSGAGGALGPGA